MEGEGRKKGEREEKRSRRREDKVDKYNCSDKGEGDMKTCCFPTRPTRRMEDQQPSPASHVFVVFFFFVGCVSFSICTLHSSLLLPLLLCLSPPLIVRLWGIQGMGTSVDWQKAGKFKKPIPNQLNSIKGGIHRPTDRLSEKKVDE